MTYMFRTRQKGWLGIDIGSASVKVAQLARHDGSVRVIARSIVSRPARVVTESPESQEQLIWSAADEVRTALSLESGFRGRQAAAVMPMGFCDVHQVSQIDVEGDLDSYVRSTIETITQCSTDHLEYDVWSSEPDAAPGSPANWNVLAVARPWSDQIYRDVTDSGLMCRTLDGVPHALARALALPSGSALPPVGVLDWGFSQATFCVVANGQPVYVRGLKDCGLEPTLSAIAGELNTTLDEAHRLLELYGVRGLLSKTSDEAATLIAELVAEPVRQLEVELAKTISHVGFQRRAVAPKEIFLFGGGSVTAGLTRHLTRRLKLATHVWSLNKETAGEGPRDCLFGAAMALSALAWEEA
jgi:Tfp pilus assembly PilM family ATPase